MGLGILTTFIIILTTIILARPQWFWQFSSPWTGTTVAAAEIPIIESLYLRPVIVFVAGSLVLVFVRLARQNPPLLARWMAVVTVCCTLSSAAAAGLMAWRPEWFWHSGQPCLAWIASGGVALFALASSAGWLAEGGILRLVLISLGLAMAGWLFCHTPSDQFTALLDLRIRLGYVVPPAMLLVAHGLLFALARQTGWPRPVRKNAFAGILPVILLPILALVLFVRSNYLRPETGLVRAVLCLDAQTGAMLWKTPVFVAAAEKTHAFNSHATPTPATDGDCVYAYFGSGLAALDRDGRILWLNHDPDYHRFSRYGTSSSVVLADDLLIIYQDSEYMGHGHHMDDQVQTQEGRRPSALIAVEKKTGAQRWRVTPEFSHDSYMTPLVWSHDGQREVVIATWKTLAGFAVRDGSLRWTHEYPMQQMVPSLAVHDDCLFVTGGNAFPCPIYAVRPPSGQKGEPGQTVWSARKEGGNMVSPVCWDGMLFCISHVGVLSCRFAETGKVHWRKRLGDRWFLGSLTAGDGKLFAVNHEGTLFVVAANSTGDVLAEYHFGENCAATPAIANGAILVRTANHLWCVSSTE
jgi:outer membrane protein assembly factor BamB